MTTTPGTESHPTARTLMDPNPKVMHPTDKISMGVHHIMKHRYRRLPVVDDAGHFMGVFGVSCLLRLVLPKAVVMEKGLESVPFVRDSLSDLHRRLKAVEDEPISLCMRDEMVRVAPDTPLLETLLTLYKTRASLPVVDPDTGKLVGVISYFDVGDKVLAAGV
ncbi:MAG: CBS domain-containing protein [Pseudomonadota bacterium]